MRFSVFSTPRLPHRIRLNSKFITSLLLLYGYMILYKKKLLLVRLLRICDGLLSQACARSYYTNTPSRGVFDFKIFFFKSVRLLTLYFLFLLLLSFRWSQRNRKEKTRVDVDLASKTTSIIPHIVQFIYPYTSVWPSAGCSTSYSTP